MDDAKGVMNVRAETSPTRTHFREGEKFSGIAGSSCESHPIIPEGRSVRGRGAKGILSLVSGSFSGPFSGSGSFSSSRSVSRSLEGWFGRPRIVLNARETLLLILARLALRCKAVGLAHCRVKC